MSDRIQLLPEVVANQIAAGEVVNRPASVVKEMMENAIDAGATCVAVNFREGGRDLIQIVDNGCGMSPVDARLAFDRHATSKIRTAEDIYKLDTFGFRGEALASIAAVAQVELRTRQPEDELGTVTEINGGQFAGQTVVSCPAGSQFMVRNLFYNVPARRRFLEKSNVSAGHIKAEFQRVALCNPQVRFELYNNDAPVYLLQPASLAGRIVDVVGAAVKHNLLEVVADTSIVKLKGYVGRPAAARKTRPDQYFFVNGRYFRSAYFQKAVLKAYEKLIPEGSFPSFFLYFEIDPERIDVNVHPQKTEVKFADEEAVWQIVNAAVRETLGKTGAVPMMDFDDAGQVDIPVMERNAFYAEPPSRSDMDYNPFQEDYGMPRSMVRPARLSDVSSGFRPSDEFTIESGTVGEEAPVADGFEDFRSGDGFDFVASTETAGQPCLIEPSEPERFTQFVRLPEGYAAALYGDRLMAVDLNRARECVLYEEYLLLLKSRIGRQPAALVPRTAAAFGVRICPCWRRIWSISPPWDSIWSWRGRCCPGEGYAGRYACRPAGRAGLRFAAALRTPRFGRGDAPREAGGDDGPCGCRPPEEPLHGRRGAEPAGCAGRVCGAELHPVGQERDGGTDAGRAQGQTRLNAKCRTDFCGELPNLLYLPFLSTYKPYAETLLTDPSRGQKSDYCQLYHAVGDLAAPYRE